MPEIIMNKSLKFYILLSLLFLLYFSTRLINIEKLPIFNDEAMYINWGRLINENFKKNIFISLTDGQQPFFIWLTAFAYKLLPNNFLLGSRLISVISGFVSLTAIVGIGKLIKNWRTGFYLGIMYIFSPFSLWYDRLAIKDSLLYALSLLIILLLIKQAKSLSKSLLLPILAGIVIGIALFTKSIAYFFIALYPLNFLLLHFHYQKKHKSLTKILREFLLNKNPYLLLTVIISLLIQSVQYLQPLSAEIGPKNAVFLLSFKEILEFPIQLWRNNAYSTLTWLIEYYSISLLFISLFGIIWGFKKYLCLNVVLVLWLITPIIFEIITAKIYIPRYFLFTQISILIFTYFGIECLLQKVKFAALAPLVILIVYIPLIKLDYQILTNPLNAKLPQVERWQYISGWPSGYGLEDLMKIVNNYKNQYGLWPNIITEQETLVSSSIPLYLSPDVLIERNFELNKDLTEYNQYINSRSNSESKSPTLIILNHNQTYPPDWNVAEYAKIKRSDNLYFLVLKIE